MSTFNAYMALAGAVDADIVRDERMSRRTSWRVGGPAALLATCHSYRALVRVVDVLRQESVPWAIVGKGSNLLVADEGYNGCVIVLGREFSRILVADDGLVTVGAGVLLSKVVNEALSHGLSGIEFAVGIPGTLGGAIAMDAGTRREWIGSRVRDVVVLRPGEGMHRYDGAQVEWGYRATSIPTSEIVLEATLALDGSEKSLVSAEMERRLARRRGTQPWGKPTCGSVFTNPGELSVGRILDECGLKGVTVGGAQVSEEHANFIVNKGGATAADIRALMALMHDKVRDGYGIDLKPEVKLLGFSS